MDQQEIDRLEQLRAELESEMDGSSEEAWLACWQRLVELYRAGDVYPACRAAKVLARLQGRGYSIPEEVQVFWPMVVKLTRPQTTDEGLEGQELLLYRSYQEEVRAAEAQRMARWAEERRNLDSMRGRRERWGE